MDRIHRSALLALGVVAFVLAQAPEAAAQRQTKAQAGCVASLHKAGMGIAAAAGKRLVTCLEATAAAATAGLEDCLAADPGGKIAKAITKAATTEASRCAATPDFGAATSAAIASAYAPIVPLQALLGSAIDDAVIETSFDAAGAACQAAIVRALPNLLKVRLKDYQRCASKGLRSARLLDGVALSTCYGPESDKKIVKAVAKAQNKIGAACGATPVEAALPGNCSDAAPTALAACVDRELACSVCERLGGADGVEGLCDLVDDGERNDTCSFPTAPDRSVAWVWNEALLEAIRRDTPRPTVHSRNLFHLSTAMWDAWVAYTGTGSPYFVSETPTPVDQEAELREALSHAAYRLLSHRFSKSVAAFTAQANFNYWMHVLGYDPKDTTTVGPTAAAVGNRIGAATIVATVNDGSNEANDYTDNTGYVPVNAPLVVGLPGATMVDPNRWQPLSLNVNRAQTGTPIPSNPQAALGPHWGNVAPFALVRDNPGDVYSDPGAPPYLDGVGDADFKTAILDVIRRSSMLDPADATMVDASPGALGNNSLGTNDGTGHAVNPVTGMPYASNMVRRADLARVIAEFWADGPASETPPGHWNTLANHVSYDPTFERRFGGVGPLVDELEWDVKLYLALNGAVHDAAVACWDAKRKYDYARPISMIRYMGGRGQSSSMLSPSYHPRGLPLEADLVEVITPATTAIGQKHRHLAGFEGQIAIRTWKGNPSNPATQTGGVGWIRAVEWVPYQLPTFVTPAFQGYTSGHSTFSRAAAEVLTTMTGSAFFPGGLHEHVYPAGHLDFENGPSADVTLQWATYYDAGDAAGQSRLWSGIHVEADDFGGRIMGSQIGIDAYQLAEQYWDGLIP
jgi:hypothetical protein